MFVDIFKTEKKYNIIYADPPWRYQDKSCAGSAEKHYSTMKLDDICNLPINNIAENDSVLFLWATYPMLNEAMRVINSWGFRYKTIGFQWVKLNRRDKGYFFGVGRWTRSNTEALLLAVKGKPHKYLVNKGISQIIEYPVGMHSQKPPVARDKIIELLGDLPRIELFARDCADGWDCWGNECGGGQTN